MTNSSKSSQILIYLNFSNKSFGSYINTYILLKFVTYAMTMIRSMKMDDFTLFII